MGMRTTLGNLRHFPRRLFEFLTVILNETRATGAALQRAGELAATAEQVSRIGERMATAEQLQGLGELVAANSLVSQRLAPITMALNDFCDEAARLLLLQQRQIDTLLSANKLLMERVQATGRRVEGQDNRLFAIEEVIKAQATVMPSWHATPEAAAGIRDVLRLLQPREAADCAKQRFGRDFDGGYVMLEDFKNAGVALSLGINDDVSWDLDVANRGLEVFQFDHTIADVPEAHERFHFNRLRITAKPEDGAATLAQAFQMAQAETAALVILKMDIEGDEWDVLDHVPVELLDRCGQIVVEFHHLERLMEPASLSQARRVFEKLTHGFFLCHVHGNNCGNLVNIHNIVLPETLEMTFAKRGLYQPVETGEVFPQGLDMPNQPGRADLFLGSFRF